MEKRKIVLFHHSDCWGGGSISLLTVADSLKETYQVVVYLPHENTDLFKEFENRNICVRSVNDNIGIINSFSGSSGTFTIDFVRYIAKIILHTRPKFREILEAEKPDIVAVNSMTLSWFGKDINKIGMKSVCFVRETVSNDLGMKLIKYYLNHYFDGIAFISEYDKSVFKSRAKIQAVIPDSLIPFHVSGRSTKKMFQNKFGRRDTLNVLFVGGTNNYPKGWFVIRDAMNFLKQYNIRLFVAGAIDEKEIVIANNITYLGICTNMEDVYAESDILVFPSTAPHQARPAYEAGFMRLPVIISDYEQTREFVKNGVNGLTFKTGNSEELAECILKLYCDAELRERLGENNYTEAIENHSYDTCKNKLHTFMQSIISETKNQELRTV